MAPDGIVTAPDGTVTAPEGAVTAPEVGNLQAVSREVQTRVKQGLIQGERNARMLRICSSVSMLDCEPKQ